jgi:uncharacterized glyoxalase superfamily protein PhnB
MSKSEMRKLSPVLIVDAIEPCLEFWVDRLGFAKTAEVPEGDQLGFVILAKDGVEVMYQTVESVRHDAPAVLASGRTPTPGSVGLFIEVSDVAAVEQAVSGLEHVVPRRQTFYGMDEVGVREPGGHVVMFAQPIGATR